MLKEKAPHTRMSATKRQRQLLDAALTVFSRKGFKGTTTKEIAATAGIAEAVIFQHFPSKEALYNAVLELNLGAWETEQDAEEIRGYMERGDDEGLIRTLILRILNCYRTNAAFQRVALFAGLEGHEQGINRLREQFAPVYMQFKEYVEKRQRDGALVDGDPFAILTGITGLAHQYGLITSIMNAAVCDLPDESVVEQFTRMLLDGVRKPAKKKKGE
jgi:TetR/AcrR family transcriptional regulator